MCRHEKNEDGFKFICTHMDGTKITFEINSSVTWHELGSEFRNFVKACGYQIENSDCLCSADFDAPLIDDIDNEIGCCYDGAAT